MIGFWPAEDVLSEGIFKVAYPCLEWFNHVIIRIHNFKGYEKHNPSRDVEIGFHNLEKLKLRLLFLNKQTKKKTRIHYWKSESTIGHKTRVLVLTFFAL